MAFYAASTTLLSDRNDIDQVKKIFYADDGGGGGTLDQLLNWWKDIQTRGPLIGYFPNAKKTWLVVKPEHAARAAALFPDINITTEGQRYLGSYIGNKAGTEKFVKDQVLEWKKDISALARIAESEPQLAYSAYVYGTSRRWQFLCRTTPDISEYLVELELEIQDKLIPALLGGRHVSEQMRKIFSLPVRLGGLCLLNPVEQSDFEYQNSQIITRQLTESILRQTSRLRINEEQRSIDIKNVQSRKNEKFKSLSDQIKAEVPEHIQRLLILSSEKGASTWLSSLPLRDYGFRLNKQQFEDAICLRYDLKLRDVPNKCGCGDVYSINHSLTCKLGGYIYLRHNAVRDTAG